MEQRKGSFFLYAALIFLALILFRSFFAPAPAPQEPGDEVAEVDADENTALNAVAEDGDNANSNQDSDDADSQADDSDRGADTENNDSESGEELVDDGPEKFFTIGRFDEKGAYQNVVTLSNKGATVHRVELNARKKNGKLLYRDLDYRAAYIGRMELTDAESGQGALINVVPPGTPAADAGLETGDIITAINGEPVGDANQFLDALKNFKPRQEVPIKFKRGESEEAVSITSADAPLQIMAPIPEEMRLDGDAFKKSFQISLHLKKGGFKSTWPELDASLRTGNWEAEVIGEDEIHFKRTLSKKRLATLGLDGPIEVTKIFRAVRGDGEGAADPGKYHFVFDIEVNNLAAQPQELALQIIGPTGTTIEGWWYQNKIHGRSSALFYTAGARDIVVGTEADPYSFSGGPEILGEYTKSRPEFYRIINPANDALGRALTFAAVDTQYFTVAMLPQPRNDAEVGSIGLFNGVAIPASEVPDTKKLQRTTDLTFQLFTEPIQFAANADGSTDNVYRQSFQIFAGPKESQVLNDYGLSDIRTFGWFAIFSKPLIWMLHLFYSIIPNYGLAIILLTFLVRLAMMPISRKAAKNALMMQYLQPEMKKIAEKYKEDFQKRGEAQNALLKKYNCHPLGGCLLMFLQLPIFIGLYRGISVDIALRDKSLIPGLNWCSNLAGPDQLFYWKDWGLPFLFDETGWLGPYFNILPIFTIVLFLIQQKLFTPPATDDQQKMMQKMMTFMMIFMGVLFFKVSSGLCIYFITSSIWGILERKLIPKPSLPEHMQVKLDEKGKGATAKVEPGKNGSSKKTVYDKSNEKLQDKRRQDRERRRKLKERQ